MPACSDVLAWQELQLTNEEAGKLSDMVHLGFRRGTYFTGFAAGPGLACCQYQLQGTRLVTMCDFFELVQHFVWEVLLKRNEAADKTGANADDDASDAEPAMPDLDSLLNVHEFTYKDVVDYFQEVTAESELACIPSMQQAYLGCNDILLLPPGYIYCEKAMGSNNVISRVPSDYMTVAGLRSLRLLAKTFPAFLGGPGLRNTIVTSDVVLNACELVSCN